jgi:hypothetical protein
MCGRDHYRAGDARLLERQSLIALQELRGREGSDVAETFLYLIKSGFTTGQIVVIDGGALIA